MCRSLCAAVNASNGVGGEAAVNSADFGLLLNCAVVLVGFGLLYASVAKLRDLAGFQIILHGYGAVPTAAAAALSRIVPMSELILAVGLLLPWSRGMAAMGAMFFFVVASAVVAASLRAGKVPAHCGCFGTRSGDPPNWGTFARGVMLAAMILAVLLSGALSNPGSGLPFVIATFAALMAVLTRDALSIERRSRPIARGIRAAINGALAADGSRNTDVGDTARGSEVIA